MRAGALTVNGLTDPVGIDPDDCQFAWTLQASGRGAAQTAFRIVVQTHRSRPERHGLGQRARCDSAWQAFVPYGGPPLAADAAYRWTVQARGADARLGPSLGSGAIHHGAACTAIGQPPTGCARPETRSNPTG